MAQSVALRFPRLAVRPHPLARSLPVALVWRSVPVVAAGRSQDQARRRDRRVEADVGLEEERDPDPEHDPANLRQIERVLRPDDAAMLAREPQVVELVELLGPVV